MTDSYNDSHRLFVQAMLTKRIISEEEAKKLYEDVKIATERPSDVEYALFIANINKELDQLDYSLRISHDERTGEPYLILVNVKQDSLTEGATNFRPIEISYCRELFDAMVNEDNEDFAISTMTAIHLGQKIKPVKLSQKETQEVLDQLVKDKWIAQERKGVYYMDTRTIAELQSYLRDQYGDLIKECTICLDVVTMGECCAVNHCPVRMHRYCAETQFKNSTNPVCPQCASKWSRTNTFGLGLPSEEQDDEDMSDDE